MLRERCKHSACAKRLQGLTGKINKNALNWLRFCNDGRRVVDAYRRAIAVVSLTSVGYAVHGFLASFLIEEISMESHKFGRQQMAEDMKKVHVNYLRCKFMQETSLEIVKRTFEMFALFNPTPTHFPLTLSDFIDTFIIFRYVFHT
jgi:hypothetical protein